MAKALAYPIPYIFVSHDSLPVTIYKDVGMGYVSFIFHNWELTKLQTSLTGSGIIYEFLDQAFWFRCPIAGSVWDSFTIVGRSHSSECLSHSRYIVLGTVVP